MNNFDFSGSIGVFFVGLALLWLVRRIFGRYIKGEARQKFHTDAWGKVLELLIITGIAYALIGVPIIDSAVGLLAKLVTSAATGWQTNISIGGSVLLLLGITIFSIIKYWKSDNEWWTVLFAVTILALSAPIPDLANIMHFLLVGPVSFIWNNVIMAIYHAIENTRFG